MIRSVPPVTGFPLACEAGPLELLHPARPPAASAAASTVASTGAAIARVNAAAGERSGKDLIGSLLVIRHRRGDRVGNAARRRALREWRGRRHQALPRGAARVPGAHRGQIIERKSQYEPRCQNVIVQVRSVRGGDRALSCAVIR
jgi:hypothetical protein